MGTRITNHGINHGSSKYPHPSSNIYEYSNLFMNIYSKICLRAFEKRK